MCPLDKCDWTKTALKVHSICGDWKKEGGGKSVGKVFLGRFDFLPLSSDTDSVLTFNKTNAKRKQDDSLAISPYK